MMIINRFFELLMGQTDYQSNTFLEIEKQLLLSCTR